MLSKIKSKIRALTEDIGENGYEVFTTSTYIFSQENINTINKVYIDNVETSDYTFDSDLNEITITASGFTAGQTVRVEYSCYNYSETELEKYIEAALTWISIYSFGSGDYEIESGEDIFPQPDNQTGDLIAIISSILIKPNYSNYSGPNISVRYPREMSKEKKIKKLVNEFNAGLGVSAIIKIDLVEDVDTDIEI